MRIEEHRLVDTDPTDELRVEWIPDETADPLVPEIVVIHYGVTETARATANVLNAREYCSSHLCIDSTGLVIQQVPFNRIAWHAGASLYKGRPSVSKFSIGIEVSNPGPLIKLPDGSYQTTYKKPWTGSVTEGYHSNTPGRGWKYWADYSQQELDMCAHLCELFRQEYGITDIVGHDSIAPGRKSDPGPAFPMTWLQEAVFPGRNLRSVMPTEPDPSEVHDTDRSPPPESA